MPLRKRHTSANAAPTRQFSCIRVHVNPLVESCVTRFTPSGNDVTHAAAVASCSSRDEGLHHDSGCVLYTALKAAAQATLRQLPLWVQTVVTDHVIGHSAQALGVITSLNAMMKLPFDEQNEKHEDELEQIWGWLTDGAARNARLTKQWSRLGFQGKNPATDFRGSGVLGLHTLLHFAKHHKAAAQAILSENEITEAFPLALAAISVIVAVVKLLEQHPALAECVFSEGGETAFYELFSKIFIAFAKHHSQAVASFISTGGVPEMAVMQYNQIHSQFFKALGHQAAIGEIAQHWEQDRNIVLVRTMLANTDTDLEDMLYSGTDITPPLRTSETNHTPDEHEDMLVWYHEDEKASERWGTIVARRGVVAC